MAGPVTVRQIAVICRALGGVADHHGDGRACGPPIEDALHEFVRKLHFIHVKQNVSPASDHKTQATERKIIMAGSSFGTIFQIS